MPTTVTVKLTVVDTKLPLDVISTVNGIRVLALAPEDSKVKVPLIVLPTWLSTSASKLPENVPLFDESRQLLSVTVPEPVYVPTRFVCTVTLVEPRVISSRSLKRTKIRLLAGSNGMNAVDDTKTENVGVAPALICVVTVGLGGPPMHRPVWGSVWHKERLTGRVAVPVSAETVMAALAPTFV